MKILFGDWETYYDADYSLSRMTPAEYVLDPRFESLGCAFCREDGRSYWVDGPDLDLFFREVPWDDVMFVSHNALFDACILAWRYHVKPRAFGDTLAMARATTYHSTGRVSLAKLAEHYGLPAKGTALQRTKGRRFAAIKSMPLMYDELVEYGRDDVEKCRWLFYKTLDEGFPMDHLELVDMQIRMAVQPQFIIDSNLLAQHLSAVLQQKADVLAETGLADRSALMSNDDFAELLTNEGVDLPMKVSKATGKSTYAFAKTDKDFTDLLEDENPRVQALVGARLAHKTTLEETRAQRLLNIANVQWTNGQLPGSLPIPLKYAGAHTGRYSGDWNVNLQNLPRAPKDELRRALKAPPGMVVVSVDASQIEARLNACLAGQEDLLAQFRDKRDVYAEFASKVYNHPVDKKTHPKERQLGKVGILSLGYGAGWRTFQGMVRNQSQRTMSVADDEAQHIVNAYRNNYTHIVATWAVAGDLIYTLRDGPKGKPFEPLGPVEFHKEFIRLPNGHRMYYHDLDLQEGNWSSWTFRWGTQTKYLYGPKVIENVIQALAFVHIMEVASRVQRFTRGLFPLAHQVHDELLYVVPEEDAEAFMKLVIEEMARPPKWMPDAPLDAEGGIGASYGDC